MKFENDMITSVESLFRHWKRACWVLDLWKQSDKNIMYPKPLSKYGWITTKDTLAIDWDSHVERDVTACTVQTQTLTKQQQKQGSSRILY